MGWNEAPIHSAYDDDPAHAEAIDAFVLSLAERIDALQDLESRVDLVALAEQADGLAVAAQRVGYPLLAQCATEVGLAARQRDASLAYKSLVQLTELAQRVRRGHRGAL